MTKASSLALAALLLAPLAAAHAADAPQPPRPKLQIINGSGQTIDIFWLKSDAERVPNGSVAPGKDTVKECILIHELAHHIHLRGMANVDPTFDARVGAAYDAAMKAGLWKGKYASVNHHEYFAVGAAAWFGHDRFNDFDHNHVHLRPQLLEYDPGLAALCREVFGDAAPSYTKPATRLTGHLAGFDPAKAPTFVWPERLKQAQEGIHANAVARDKAANGDSNR